MIRRFLPLLALCWPLVAQMGSLDFAPQGGGKKAVVWAVSGCLTKSVPVATIYHLATVHGIAWLTPKAAGDILATKTFWGRAYRWTAFASAGASGLIALNVIKTNPQILAAVTAGSALLNLFVPLAQKQVPAVDPAAGQSLNVGPDGCGTALFYALPSAVGPFAETLK